MAGMIKRSNEIQWGVLYAVMWWIYWHSWFTMDSLREMLSSQGLRFWHGPLRSIFLSIYLSPICLLIRLCSPSKFQYSSHANSLTHSIWAWIWTAARNQHLRLLSVCLSLTHFSIFYCILPLQLFTTLMPHSVLVASQSSQIMCPCVNRLEVVNTTNWVSALTRPVTEY